MLSKLDDEVLELTEDDDLDAEVHVEQADEIREKIDLAILNIEDNLQTRRMSEKTDSSRTSSRRRIDSNSSAASKTREVRRSSPPATHVAHYDHPAPISSAPVSTHTVTGSVAPPVIAFPATGLSTSAHTYYEQAVASHLSP